MSRHAVDRVEFLAVEGWALGPEGQLADVTLWHDSQRLPATLERVPRPDVQAHCGGAVALDSGFVLRLDGADWWQRVGGQPARCTLRVQGAASAELMVALDEAEFVAWIDSVAAMPSSPQRTAEWTRLQPLLATTALGHGDLPLWAENCWQLGGVARSESLRASAERIEGLRISGWVSDTATQGEHFVVHCHRQSWPVRARRIARDDVRQALHGAGPRCGFELDLPSGIWAATPPGADAWVQLSVNGHRLWPHPQRVARAALLPLVQVALHWLDSRSSAAPPVVGGEAWLLAADHGFRQAQVLTHALVAGLPTPSLDEMQARLRRHLAPEDAEALTPWLAGDAGRFVASSAPSDGARTVWRLQQAFNTSLGDAVAAGGQGATAIRQSLARLLAEHPAQPAECLQPFLASLVPTFCGVGGLSALRPLLADDHLDSLERHDGRWELSLLLPLRLRDELPARRLTAAVALARRIARPDAVGWLNTVTVLDAVTQLHQALQSGVMLDDEEVQRFVEAMLTLWQSLAADPLWSRLHDHHLLRGHVQLLRCRPWLDDEQAEQVLQSALRHYALVPAFWRIAEQELPSVEWPDALLAARMRAGPALAALTTGTAADQAANTHQLLAWARAEGVGEVASLQRHALQAAAARGDTDEAWQTGLPPADRLRTVLEGERAEAAWRQVSPTPWPSQVAVRASAWEAHRELGHAGAGNDPERRRAALAHLRAAANERAGFVGLPLLLQVARSVPAELAAEVGRSLTEALEFALAACALRQIEHPWPPAALAATAAGLAHWAGQTGAPAWVQGLHQRWSMAATGVWGAERALAATALPDAVESPSSAPGASVLVVLRRSAETAVAASPWINALSQGQSKAGHGISLCLWHPTGDAAVSASVHAGLTQLLQPNLFDLLRYLLAHSDHGAFYFVDADSTPALDAWLARTGILSAHYHGQAGAAVTRQVRVEPNRLQLDLSPADLPTARVSTGLGLSRQALAWALDRLDDDTAPAWLTQAVDAERLLAKLLAAAGVSLDQRGQWHFCARPAVGFLDLPPPGPGSPTVLTLGTVDDPLASCLREATPHGPARIWPTDRAPSVVGALGSQQLVRLRDPWAGAPPPVDEVGVFAVARNERVLMPHFLAHYRALGVRRFTIADNLSDDGTREYLLGQPDVMLYSVDTPYKLSHYGVAWQQAMLAAHAQGRWALVVDIDEFLVWPGCEAETLTARCARLAAGGHDAALALMVDMYPDGPLDAADFERGAPFAEAPCFDAVPALRWRLGSGSYSNSPSYVSNARHRLLPGSPPNHYTAQKVPLLRYHPFVRWSEGLHYAAGVQRAPEPLFLAHFKYHRGFRAKVEEEVARKQHYNDAEEYRKYRALWDEARGMMFDPAVSRRYVDSQSFADIPWN